MSFRGIAAGALSIFWGQSVWEQSPNLVLIDSLSFILVREKILQLNSSRVAVFF